MQSKFHNDIFVKGLIIVSLCHFRYFQSGLEQIKNRLGTSFDSASTAAQLTLLRNAETQLMSIGQQLYGPAGWKGSYTCGLLSSDSTTSSASSTVKCGDRRINPPACSSTTKWTRQPFIITSFNTHTHTHTLWENMLDKMSALIYLR